MPVARCKGAQAGSEQGLESSLRVSPSPPPHRLFLWTRGDCCLRGTGALWTGGHPGGKAEDDPGFLTEGRRGGWERGWRAGARSCHTPWAQLVFP